MYWLQNIKGNTLYEMWEPKENYIDKRINNIMLNICLQRYSLYYVLLSLDLLRLYLLSLGTAEIETLVCVD